MGADDDELTRRMECAARPMPTVAALMPSLRSRPAVDDRGRPLLSTGICIGTDLHRRYREH